MDPVNRPGQYIQRNDYKILFEIVVDEAQAISPEFKREIESHVSLDREILKNTFKLIGNINKVFINPTLGETHFGGKKPVFLTLFTSFNEKYEVVYKPRSVLPEKYLEAFLEKIHSTPSRLILDCKTYGYDTFVKGKTLQEAFVKSMVDPYV